MPQNDLCTVPQVLAFLPQGTETDAVTLGALITAASGAILSDIQRAPVYAQTYTDVFDGYGGYETRKMLRKWPVLSVTSLVIYNNTLVPSTIQPATGGFGGGWVLEPWDGQLPGRPQLLDLRGMRYWAGTQNITATYVAGYQVSGEQQLIPATSPYVLSPLAPMGPWCRDGGVLYVGGTALVPVAASPSAGQYVPPVFGAATTQYTFSPADAGRAVATTYSFVPSPLNQAAIEVASEAYRYRQRVGLKSQAMPGPLSTSYDLSRATAAVRWMTQPYRQVVPLP